MLTRKRPSRVNQYASGSSWQTVCFPLRCQREIILEMEQLKHRPLRASKTSLRRKLVHSSTGGKAVVDRELANSYEAAGPSDRRTDGRRKQPSKLPACLPACQGAKQKSFLISSKRAPALAVANTLGSFCQMLLSGKDIRVFFLCIPGSTSNVHSAAPPSPTRRFRRAAPRRAVGKGRNKVSEQRERRNPDKTDSQAFADATPGYSSGILTTSFHE